MEWTVLSESLSKFESLLIKNVKVDESKESVGSAAATVVVLGVDGISQKESSSVSVVSIPSSSSNTIDENHLTAFQESVMDIVADIVHGKTQSAERIARFKLIPGFKSSHQLQDVLCDALWFWGTQCSAATTGTATTTPTAAASSPPAAPEWTRLCAFIKDLYTSSLVDTSKLKLGLDINLLVGAGVLPPDENRVQRTLIKFNTGMLYQQQKYNLMREETEGYAKLAVALCHLPCSSYRQSGNSNNSTATVAVADAHINHIFALVGQFDLDPNRVLDIILDTFEQQCGYNNHSFIRLLSHFKQSNIASIIGLKFVNYHASPVYSKPVTTVTTAAPTEPVTFTPPAATVVTKPISSTAPVTVVEGKENTDNTNTSASPPSSPTSLYTLAATLLVHDLIRMDQLFAYLEPSLEEIITRMQAQERDMRNSIVKYGVVSLTATSGTSTASQPQQSQSQSQTVAVPPAGRPPLPPLPRSAPPSTSSSTTTAPHLSQSKTDSTSAIVPSSTIAPVAVTNVNNNNDASNSNNIEEEWNADFFQSITGIAPPASALKEDGNQVTGLLAALLKLRGWEQALPLLKIFQSRRVDIMRCVQVKHAMTALLAWRLNTLYYDDTIAAVSSNTAVAVSPRRFTLARPAEYTMLSSSHNTSSSSSKTSSSPLVSVTELYTNAARTAGLCSTDGSGLLVTPTTTQQHQQLLQLALPFCSHQCLPFIDLHSFPLDASEMLSYLSHHIGDNAAVFTQLCRLLRAHRDVVVQAPVFTMSAADETAKKEYFSHLDVSVYSKRLEPMLQVISTILLPALSVSEGNAFLASQVWAIIAPLPFAHRFALYDCWRDNGFAKDALLLQQQKQHTNKSVATTTAAIPHKPLEVVYAEVKVLHVCKGYIKRLSKENTRTVGRQLARLTHACPLPVFNHILSQIEVFDNLIPVVVEALRYSTEMSRDAMAGLLLTQLQKDTSGSGEGSKLKKGDTHYTDWFAALSKFISTYYARYPETEIKGVLHYLLKRLQLGQSLDLLVLRDLLGKMGRCETLIEVSAQQLESLAGGRVLRTEMMAAVSSGSGVSASGGSGGSKPAAVMGVLSPEASRKGVRLLREELITSGTAVPLLLYLAQVRSRILHCTDTPHLKLISHLFDTAQDVLMQFTDFLVGAVPPVGKQMQHMAQLMPSLTSLVCDSGLSVSVAFQLVRPIVRAALVASSSSSAVSGSEESCSGSSAVPEYLQQWHPFSDELRKVVIEYYAPPLPQQSTADTDNGNMDIAITDAATDGGGSGTAGLGNINTNTTNNIWTLISPDLVIAFWSLSLSDLSCPHERYATETRRLRDKYTELDKLSSGGSGSSGGLVDEKTAKLRRTEATRLLSSIKDLNDEYEAHKKHVDNVRQYVLLANKNTFISERGRMDVQLTTEVLLQVCVLERVLMSPADAIYAVQFFLLLHSLDTPGFSTITFMNKFIQTVVPLVFCTTEVEAGFLGYALAELLKTVNLYLADKEVFREASLKCGFAINNNNNSGSIATSPTTDTAAATVTSTTADSANTAVTTTATENITTQQQQQQQQHLTYEKWKKVTKHFSKNLTTILHNALNSSEYMHLRSALLLLSRIAGEYPTTTSVGVPLLTRVEAVAVAQSALNRGDLALAAKSVGAMLKRQLASGAWVKDDVVIVTNNTSSATSTASSNNKVTNTYNKSTKTSSGSSGSSSTSTDTNSKKIDTKNRNSSTATATSSSSSSSSSISKSSSSATLNNNRDRDRDRNDDGGGREQQQQSSSSSDRKRPHSDVIVTTTNSAASNVNTSSSSNRGAAGGGNKDNVSSSSSSSKRDNRDKDNRGGDSSSGRESRDRDRDRGSGSSNSNSSNTRHRDDRSQQQPQQQQSQQSQSTSSGTGVASSASSSNNTTINNINNKREQDSRERDQKQQQRERDRDRFSKTTVTAVLTVPPAVAAVGQSTASSTKTTSGSRSSDNNRNGGDGGSSTASSVEVVSTNNVGSSSKINADNSSSNSSQSKNSNNNIRRGSSNSSEMNGNETAAVESSSRDGGSGNSKRSRMETLMHTKSPPMPVTTSTSTTATAAVAMTEEQRLRQTLISSMNKTSSSSSNSNSTIKSSSQPLPSPPAPLPNNSSDTSRGQQQQNSSSGNNNQRGNGPQIAVPLPPPLVSNNNNNRGGGGVMSSSVPLPPPPLQQQQSQQRLRGNSASYNTSSSSSQNINNNNPPYYQQQDLRQSLQPLQHHQPPAPLAPPRHNNSGNNSNNNSSNSSNHNNNRSTGGSPRGSGNNNNNQQQQQQQHSGKRKR